MRQLKPLREDAMSDMYFTKDREWVRMGEDGLATVGITGLARTALGEVLAVSLPEPGLSVARGDACAALKSAVAECSILAPLSGTITEINPALADDPALVNQAPEAAGWLFKMRLNDPTAYTTLMDQAAHGEFLAAG
jgi:glycine cleavage system H protein